jgi:hypothetical protein
MKELTLESAKKFAAEKFKSLSKVEQELNILHSSYLIEALEELPHSGIVLIRLRALAWVHDIGKVLGNDNHAENSLKILEKEFVLNDIDKDCILNHGSSSIPKTKEGILFRMADGLSLFYPEIARFILNKESEETNDEKAKASFKERYETYLKAYSNSLEAIALLERNYKELNNTETI